MAGKRKGSRRKKGSRKKMKLASMPTMRTISLSAGEASQQHGIVEVSALLSQCNNRLYRQGMNYEVAFAMTEPTQSTIPLQLSFYTLPNNWFTLGAVQHAFKQWRATLQDELAQTGGKHSKWLDFRIAAGGDGSPASNKFYPNFFDGNSHTAVSTGYVQTYSQVSDAAGDLMGFTTATEDVDGAGSYNIMLQFARHLLSRKADDSTESGPQAYEGLHNDSLDLDQLMEEGSAPPYDEDYAMWHNAANADDDIRLAWADTLYVGKGSDSDDTTSRASGSRVVTRTFTAPLGLVWVEGTSNFVQTSDSEFALIAKAGNYKGVAATPIYHFDVVGSTAKSLR